MGQGVYMEMMERVAAEDEPALAVEDAQVRRWRHAQFVLLGFSDAQALLLAGSEGRSRPSALPRRLRLHLHPRTPDSPLARRSQASNRRDSRVCWRDPQGS